MTFFESRGGLATTRELLAAGVTRSALSRARANGTVLKVHRGVYGAGIEGGAERIRVAVAATGGVVSHDSAAALLGVEMVHRPPTTLTVGRNSSTVSYPGCDIERATLAPEEITSAGGMPVTAPLRTVLDCARRLGFRDALVIADSAIRQDLLDQADLIEAARRMRGPGAGRVRRVAENTDAFTDSAMESVLRALLMENDLAPARTQFDIRTRDGRRLARVDFAWPRLRTVVEADGFEFHTDRESFRKDRRLGNAMTLAGWRLLRFTWEDVFTHPAYVLDTVRKVLAAAERDPRTNPE